MAAVLAVSASQPPRLGGSSRLWVGPSEVRERDLRPWVRGSEKSPDRAGMRHQVKEMLIAARWCYLLALIPFSHAYLLQSSRPVLSPFSVPATGLHRRSSTLARVKQGRSDRLRNPTSMNMEFDPLISGVSTVASALFFFAWETRPAGNLAVDLDVDVIAKPSTISGAGLGLFAARDLEAGTVLGMYPGRVWSADAWLRFKGLEPTDYLLDKDQRDKLQQERQRKAEIYTWKLAKALDSEEGDDTRPGATPTKNSYTASFVIDPTSTKGELSDTVPWILNTFATMPTLLCRINEPGRGGDVNVVAEEEEDSVTFVLERTVKAGEELFLDYGPYYDRANYCGEDKIRYAVRSVLDSVLQRQDESAGVQKWGYSQFVSAAEADKVASVTFSGDGTRLLATDKAGNRFELDDLPPDSAILDTLAKHKVDISVLPE